MTSTFKNLVDRSLCGFKVNDVTSGFRIYKIEVLKALDTGSIKSDGYAYNLETLQCLRSKKFIIFEYPIRFINRKKGKSKLGMAEMLEYIHSVTLFFLHGRNA